MDFTSPWKILAVGLGLLAAIVGGGIRLSRSEKKAWSDLGLALITGAVIACSVIVLEFLLAQRARKLESDRQAEAEQQALQLLVGRQRNLAGIDLGCSPAERDSDCGEVLDGFYLNGKNLREANLRGSSLRRARLENARLQQAILVRADLEDSSLERAHLERAILDGARLDRARLRFANLEGARLRGAYLVDADLNFAVVRADLAGARLMGARLFGADLENANLRKAKLQRADLRSANLTGANLAGADLRNAKVAGADFTNARFDAATTWPDESTRWPECAKPVCVVKVRVRHKAERELAVVRGAFARCLPDGWIASPRDPGGFTFAAPIHGALFFGEQHDIRPGSSLAEFAHEWRESARVDHPGLLEGKWGPVRLDAGGGLPGIDGGRVWINRFQYRLAKGQGREGQAWEQLEVYGIAEDTGYRFFAKAPADVFMLFDRDFGKLFSALGLDPRSAFPTLRDVRICRRSARARPTGAR